MAAWRNGVVLDDGYKTKPGKVRVTGAHGKDTWMQAVLTEARKRQMREMGRFTGLPVVRIIRMQLGSLRLGNLKPGEWSTFSPAKIENLKGRGR